MMTRLVACVAAVALASTACSVVMVRNPTPLAATRPPVTCPSGWPTLDSALAVVGFASVLIPHLGGAPENADGRAARGALLGLAVAAPFVVSALVGSARISRCHDGQRAWQAQLDARRGDADAREVSGWTPADLASAERAGQVGTVGMWCRPQTPSSTKPPCDENMPCQHGRCVRACRELSPGAEMWSCGVGFKCTADRSGCVQVAPR